MCNCCNPVCLIHIQDPSCYSPTNWLIISYEPGDAHIVLTIPSLLVDGTLADSMSEWSIQKYSIWQSANSTQLVGRWFSRKSVSPFDSCHLLVSLSHNFLLESLIGELETFSYSSLNLLGSCKMNTQTYETECRLIWN